MTTPTDPPTDVDPSGLPDPVGRHAAAEPPTRPGGDAAQRGSLSIDDGVVEKVAVAAAGEIDGVGGAARRLLGVPTGSDGTEHATAGRPRVSARVTGQTAVIELRLSVAYPASVRATTEAVRAHVRERVATLTELTVSRVDITVASLSSPAARTRRRVT